MPSSHKKRRPPKAVRCCCLTPKRPSRFDRNLGRRLRRLRMDRDLSQRELAASVGVTVRRLREHEQATERITADILVKYLKALNVLPREFFK